METNTSIVSRGDTDRMAKRIFVLLDKAVTDLEGGLYAHEGRKCVAREIESLTNAYRSLKS